MSNTQGREHLRAWRYTQTLLLNKFRDAFGTPEPVIFNPSSGTVASGESNITHGSRLSVRNVQNLIKPAVRGLA
jgi:hypothetical protein